MAAHERFLIPHALSEIPKVWRIDVHVGSRISSGRADLGLSQLQLAEKLEVTLHQMQSYEIGKKRAGASILFDLSCLFDVPISYFFDDAPRMPRPRCASGEFPRNDA